MNETYDRPAPEVGDAGESVRNGLMRAGGLHFEEGGGRWCEDALAAMQIPRSEEFLRPLHRLHTINSRQWDAEDRVRQAGDGEVPAIKQEIDELNGLRHERIEEVDRALSSAWHAAPGTPPLTESMGSALDRLSVLTLRVVHTQRLVSDDVGFEDRVSLLLRQRDELVWSIAVACEDLVSGRRRAPLPERMKLYGKPRP